MKTVNLYLTVIIIIITQKLAFIDLMLSRGQMLNKYIYN